MSNIRRWLSELGLHQYGDVFEANDLDVDVLPDLSEADLEKIGVSLGHRKKLIRAIASLRASRAGGDDRHPGAKPSPAGERRQATVLFSDLTGYTAMNEALDPEDVERAMSRIKAEAVLIVERHGGIVNQFVGDEVLALFGIAAAHDDDPVRAVRAALDLHEMVRRVSPEIEQRLGQPVRLHTGINTGLIVTHPGDDRDGRYGVTGDAINVGARLKALAEPDAILLSPDTTRLTSAYFTTVPEAPVRLKGKSEAVVPHRVTGRTQISSRFAAAQRRGLTPLAGRAREVASLNSCLGSVLDGKGQLVTIAGDPGAGKSRLLFEFRHGLDRDRVHVLQARCQSFGRDMSYAPFTDLLRSGLQLDDLETSEGLLEKAIANVIAIDPGLDKYIPHVLQLLSIPNEKYLLPPNFEGEEKRRAFEEALAKIFTLISRARPLVVILEDWHWSDEASDSALPYLVDKIAEFPVLVLVNYRPEYEEHWGELGNHTSLLLKSLGPDDTEAMVTHSLGATDLPEDLCSLISSRADGNPLFIEEVCRSLVEDGTVRIEGQTATLTRPARDIILPDTVKAVIRGRLDRLEEIVQEPLRVAAVIGREFGMRILERVHGDAARLDEPVAVLVAQDVIQRVKVVPEIAFIFKHVLVQVVVYETLLLQRRRELHARVAEAMEVVYADRLPQYYEALAHHFDLGEVWHKAATYRVQAGIKATQHHSIGSALKQLDRARQIIAEHAPKIPWSVRYDLCLHRGAALGDRGQWPVAYQEISEAERLAESEADVGRRVQAQVARANAAFWAHEFDDALSIIADLEGLLGGNPDIQLRIASQQAMINFMVERLPTALAKEKEVHALFRAAPDSRNRGYAAWVAGTFLRWRGANQEASELLDSAVKHDRANASAGVYLQSLMHYCLAIGELGQYQAAIDLLLEGRDYGLAADSLYGLLKIHNTLGWAYQEVCSFDKAIEFNQMSILSTDEARGSNTSTLSEVASFARLNLGDVYLATGRLDLARGQFEAVAQNLRNMDFFLARTRWKPRCLVGLGELWLALGDVEKAEALLAELDAHGFTDGFPFRKLQARAGRLRGAVLATRGRADAAVEALESALGRARSVGNPTQLWKLHLALGELLAENGKEERAKSCFRDACEVVESVAKGLRDPALKAGFLNASPIRHVLSKAGD